MVSPDTFLKIYVRQMNRQKCVCKKSYRYAWLEARIDEINGDTPSVTIPTSKFAGMF